jgi:hypothetical protein
MRHQRERLRLGPVAASITLAFGLAASSLGCALRASPPSEPPVNAQTGFAPRRFDPTRACTQWIEAAGADDTTAYVHDSFPELHPDGCYIPVRYDEHGPKPDPIPPSCGYPDDPDAIQERLRAEADRYDHIAAGRDGGRLPPELACELPPDIRSDAARMNAATLRKLARRIENGRRYPYAAVSALGFGSSRQGRSPLVKWRPGDACVQLDKAEMDRLDVNVTRAGRAAGAYFARVAPVVTLSGSAVHSPLYEAFAMAHLLSCTFGVRLDAVLVDPCADHTHTNLRNTGSLVVALGGRTSYVVTDDGLQSLYLQEWNGFHLIRGSIDHRSLRDFGYLVGSFRQASVGMDAGFWFTPYRFWAAPRHGLGSFTCVR